MRRVEQIHFVGIGGIGMCGLAELLHGQGYRVSGSDQSSGATVARLRALGVTVALGHAAANVGAADVLVYSSAIQPTNPEIVEAQSRSIAVIPRGQMLAEVMRLADGIAVGGSHGKTTTTSLIAHVLGTAGLDPTAVIGGRVMTPGSAAADRSGVRVGSGELFVAEADESDGSFLRLAPVIAVATNIDREHLDYYGSFDAVRDAFVEFANSVPFWGAAVLCQDDPGVASILPRLSARTLTYGFDEAADLIAFDAARSGYGMTFRVRTGDEILGEAAVPLPGSHNIANALAALSVARELEVPFETAAAALATFPGVERRFEHKGRAGGVLVVDDYGHNPGKVRATLAAARAAHDGRIVVVFQPHRYTRTRDCFQEFSAAFGDADRLVVTEVHAAGEEEIPGFDGIAVAEAIRAQGHPDVHFIAALGDIAKQLPGELEPGDLLITLGAGSVSSLGPQLLEAIARDREPTP
jgi:UDP-N-acetylmuramate--alanine ligase